MNDTYEVTFDDLKTVCAKCGHLLEMTFKMDGSCATLMLEPCPHCISGAYREGMESKEEEK